MTRKNADMSRYLQVQCPTCGVTEGRKCLTKTGKDAQPHEPRIRRWWDDYRAHRNGR